MVGKCPSLSFFAKIKTQTAQSINYSNQSIKSSQSTLSSAATSPREEAHARAPPPRLPNTGAKAPQATHFALLLSAQHCISARHRSSQSGQLINSSCTYAPASLPSLCALPLVLRHRFTFFPPRTSRLKSSLIRGVALLLLLLFKCGSYRPSATASRYLLSSCLESTRSTLDAHTQIVCALRLPLSTYVRTLRRPWPRSLLKLYSKAESGSTPFPLLTQKKTLSQHSHPLHVHPSTLLTPSARRRPAGRRGARATASGTGPGGKCSRRHRVGSAEGRTAAWRGRPRPSRPRRRAGGGTPPVD